MSYAGINAAELKKDNPSSLLFELYREEHGADATAEDLENSVRRIGYFDPAISPSRLIGRAYVEGLKLQNDTEAPEPARNVSCASDRVWSPSALDVFFDCPRRFMLHYLLGIPEPEETDRCEVVSAADGGTLATDFDTLEFKSIIRQSPACHQ